MNHEGRSQMHIRLTSNLSAALALVTALAIGAAAQADPLALINGVLLDLETEHQSRDVLIFDGGAICGTCRCATSGVRWRGVGTSNTGAECEPESSKQRLGDYRSDILIGSLEIASEDQNWRARGDVEQLQNG